MKIKLLCTALLLFLGLFACGNEKKETDKQKSSVKVETETKDIAKETSALTNDKISIELLGYDYAEMGKTKSNEKIFCLSLVAEDAETLCKYASSALNCNVLGILTMKDKQGHYIMIYLNGVYTKPTIMFSENGDSYDILSSPDWYVENPTKAAETYIIDLYNRAVDGETIGF